MSKTVKLKCGCIGTLYFKYTARYNKIMPLKRCLAHPRYTVDLDSYKMDNYIIPFITDLEEAIYDTEC